MRLFQLLGVFSILATGSMSHATTHEVGSNKQYASFEAAASVCSPGDTILFFEATYNSRQNIIGLQGTESEPIAIMAAKDEKVVFSNSNEAWHLTNVAHLQISGFIFEDLRTNGVNIDDGGDYSTPSHHILIRECIFRDMDATGNNDLLKLSGVDYLQVLKCTFLNGSAGGSGLDMVGCHNVSIVSNSFENMGSNAIQAKGGTQYIQILQNTFINCGHRSVNLGGSTGLQYFRPIDAKFEAADISVYSNVFIGSIASVAYVGSVRVDVSNNTMIDPEKWAFRILQETVDTTRFLPCGQNRFANNLIYCDSRVTTASNIGPNTAAETFQFSNNLWFNHENTNWTGPSIPVTDPNQITQVDPLLKDPGNADYDLQDSSPAIGAGIYIVHIPSDYLERPFNDPPSIGAFEGDPAIGSATTLSELALKFWPIPANDLLWISGADQMGLRSCRLFDLDGCLISEGEAVKSGSESFRLDLPKVPGGIYILDLGTVRKKLVINSR